MPSGCRGSGGKEGFLDAALEGVKCRLHSRSSSLGVWMRRRMRVTEQLPSFTPAQAPSGDATATGTVSLTFVDEVDETHRRVYYLI